MSDRLCAQLVAWGSAWLAGAAAFDDVLDAVAWKSATSPDPDSEPTACIRWVLL